MASHKLPFHQYLLRTGVLSSVKKSITKPNKRQYALLTATLTPNTIFTEQIFFPSLASIVPRLWWYGYHLKESPCPKRRNASTTNENGTLERTIGKMKQTKKKKITLSCADIESTSNARSFEIERVHCVCVNWNIIIIHRWWWLMAATTTRQRGKNEFI